MTRQAARRINLANKKSGLFGKFRKGNLVKLVLPKLATIAINLVSIGPRVILRYTFQILRTNIWTRLISTIFLISFDLYNFSRKKISKKQLTINLVLAASLLVGGSTGWIFGTNSVSAIVAENTLIWIIAGIIGAGILSSVLDSICRKMLGKFLQSDTLDMLDIINEEFNCIAAEYSLDDEAADEIAATVYINEKTCINCFCKSDKKKYAREILMPYFEKTEST